MNVCVVSVCVCACACMYMCVYDSAFNLGSWPNKFKLDIIVNKYYTLSL